jgi:hypothetical protein
MNIVKMKGAVQGKSVCSGREWKCEYNLCPARNGNMTLSSYDQQSLRKPKNIPSKSSTITKYASPLDEFA